LVSEPLIYPLIERSLLGRCLHGWLFRDGTPTSSYCHDHIVFQTDAGTLGPPPSLVGLRLTFDAERGVLNVES
jgi:hypothetical protein